MWGGVNRLPVPHPGKVRVTNITEGKKIAGKEGHGNFFIKYCNNQTPFESSISNNLQQFQHLKYKFTLKFVTVTGQNKLRSRQRNLGNSCTTVDFITISKSTSKFQLP